MYLSGHQGTKPESSAAAIAASIQSLDAPTQGQTILALPTMPAGFEIQIVSSSREDVVPKDAQIFPVIGQDTVVVLVLEVTEQANGASAKTQPLQLVIPGIASSASIQTASLQSVLAQAKQHYEAADRDSASYSMELLKALGDAIHEAESVCTNPGLGQDAVDTVQARLHRSITALLANEDKMNSGLRLESVTLTADTSLLRLDGRAELTLSGKMSDGSEADLRHAQIQYITSNANRIAAVQPTSKGAVVQAGTKLESAGTATVTALVTMDGTTRTAEASCTVEFAPDQPFNHAYHQTLAMKMFMADRKGEVFITFEQALDIMKRVDRITRGIPKIIYLVGWQFEGHDTGYPALHVVNEKLKRREDATAEDSLKWLMSEARQYHTTVSLHINLLDASDTSPLWQEYVDKDVIARLEDGSLRTYVWGYPISYTREWEEGLTQRRIDQLLQLLPVQEAGTIHVDAFHQHIPQQQIDPISPYHGIPVEKEIEAQKQIIRYFRDRGIDFTAEFDKSYRSDPLIGLQPFAWHVRFQAEEQLKIPASLYCGGDGGDPRFGTSMLGESIMKKDPILLAGFLQDFALNTLPWYFLNRLDRLTDESGTLHFSEQVTSSNKDNYRIIKQANRLLRDGDDVLFPALWNKDAIEWIAYSKQGYTDKEWRLPDTWNEISQAVLYEIGLEGLTGEPIQLPIINGTIKLTLQADQGVSLFPVGMEPVNR
ncbi:endo-alpha-N-acetylgalactosaminidase family protein [Paenibacillus sp. UNC451MF]|uniref:endo-alpha-N-acetylgalactosaminidase family protein n=1 Tax=Paenibacillus sp. UNC451MF TaxID=1449063 RepID=UPI00068EE7AD|nr:endo-alpha-N-acetylgalactosaminidase family protein [Paenibacillus sp. UNC451MF]